MCYLYLGTWLSTNNFKNFLYIFTEAISDLVICRISKQAGSVRGGDEIFMLCEKVQKGKKDSHLFFSSHKFIYTKYKNQLSVEFLL